MNIKAFFTGKKSDSIHLTKSKSGDWMVKKGYSILYIGSKEKCETFLAHSLTT